MLSVADILSDLDVLGLDVQIEDDFGTDWAANLAEKRRIAVEDLVAPKLLEAGYSPQLHLARKAPDVAWAFTGGVYTSQTEALSDKTADDVEIAAIFATPANDALFVGMREPYRGLYVGMLDTVNAVVGVSSITYWNGGKWAGVNSLVDGTQVTSNSISFSGGGRVRWQLPEAWARRPLGDNVDWRYYVRIQLSATPTNPTKVGQLLPIQRSRLTLPAAYLALGLMYEEAAGGNRGEWTEKGERFYKRGEVLLDRAVPHLRDEFDVDESQAVQRTEVNSITPDAGLAFEWLRG